MVTHWTRAALATLTLLGAAGCGGDGAGGAEARDRYALPGTDVFPEGIAAAPDGQSFYVGSTVTGAIYRAEVDGGAAEVFLPGGADGRTDVRGIKVAPNGRLFAAGGATARIYVYETGSRTLVASLPTGGTPATSFVNDLAIAPSGDVFATDSRAPVIYRIPSGVTAQQPQLERWLELADGPITFQPAPAFNLNGIVPTADGQYLLTVHSASGNLYRIAVGDKSIAQVSLGGATLPSGDGLLLDGRTLWAMTRATGTGAGAVVKLHLSAGYDTATVESSTPDDAFAFPTTIASAGGRLLVVNSQLDRRQSGVAPVLPFTITAMPLP
jgi:Cu-Zn family superoxide dismutase